MNLTIKDINGNSQGELEVKFPLIENGRGTQAVHETIVAFQAAQRSGTACTKTMGEVAGSGKKPWRQKGTGRARAGSFASPLWRGGGVVFGPKPRDYRKKVSRQTRQLALRKALSERMKAGDVVLLNELKLATHKTKDFLRVLTSLQIAGSVLVVVEAPEANLMLASRNVPDIEITIGTMLNSHQVLKYDKLLFTQPAYAQVEKRLTPASQP